MSGLNKVKYIELSSFGWQQLWKKNKEKPTGNNKTLFLKKSCQFNMPIKEMDNHDGHHHKVTWDLKRKKRKKRKNTSIHCWTKRPFPTNVIVLFPAMTSQHNSLPHPAIFYLLFSYCVCFPLCTNEAAFGFICYPSFFAMSCPPPAFSVNHVSLRYLWSWPLFSSKFTILIT